MKHLLTQGLVWGCYVEFCKTAQKVVWGFFPRSSSTVSAPPEHKVEGP